MLSTKKLLLNTLIFLLAFYVLICAALYFLQEKMIFFPEKLDKNYAFSFPNRFEEVYINSGEGKRLHGLQFRADRAKGLVFYLHGNAGSLNSWGAVAQTYTALHYDVFLLDYPGYGKSEGAIHSQAQLFEAVQRAYDEMKKRYREEEIVVLGYSIGTGPATRLAATNAPRLLILQAPFYSLTDMMRNTYPIVPRFLLKYKFPTHEYIRDCKMPVVVFHGNRDEVIYYGSSLKLQKELKPTDTLITLHGQGHNGMTDHPEYIDAMRQLLE